MADKIDEIMGNTVLQLNKQANKEYGNMRKAEEAIVNNIQNSYIANPPGLTRKTEKRANILICTEELSMHMFGRFIKEREEAVKRFMDECEVLAQDQKFKGKYGIQTTAPPELVTPDGIFPITTQDKDRLFDAIESFNSNPIEKITYRSEIAYRGTHMDIIQVKNLLNDRIEKRDEITKRYSEKRDYKRSTASRELQELNKKTRAILKALEPKIDNAKFRAMSGRAEFWTPKFFDKKDALDGVPRVNPEIRPTSLSLVHMPTGGVIERANVRKRDRSHHPLVDLQIDNSVIEMWVEEDHHQELMNIIKKVNKKLGLPEGHCIHTLS